MVNYLLLAVALALSFVAAYYSIVGLAFIFSAAMIPVIIMGSMLELAKVVSSSWLYRNWVDCPKLIKYYLVTAVLVLMFITSMGIFGFLSKAHIDQNVTMTDNSIVVNNLKRQIQSEESNIANAQRNLDILDGLVTKADPKDANYIRVRQKKEREAINSQIRSSSDKIKALNIELAPLQQESARIEAEVGPIKYVADLIYGESDKKVIEKAVRVVIIIIVAVFDPLAIAMLLAANYSLTQPTSFKPVPEPESKPKGNKKQPKVKSEPPTEPKEDWSPFWFNRAKQLINKKKFSKIEIDKKDIMKIK